MQKLLSFWLIGGVLALALALSACGGGGTEPADEEDPTSEEAEMGGETEGGEPTVATEGEPEAPTEAAPAEGGEGEPAPSDQGSGEASTSLEIANQGEQLLFNKEQLGPVPSGEQVSLTLNNSSVVNPHNWVLLNTNDEAQAEEFSLAGAQQPADANHLPEDPALVDLIIANTGFLAAGANDSDTIDFTAPAPGEYIYVCTVPGHYQAGMWGTLTVQ
jgi:azurin